jgi:hypothetical protein
VTERDGARRAWTELEQQAAGLTTERRHERRGRGELESKYGATQKELEELRRQNAEAQKRLAGVPASSREVPEDDRRRQHQRSASATA